MRQIKHVSINLFRQADSKLTVKLVVPLLDGMNKDWYYNLYSTTSCDYLTMTINPYVTIQYKPQGKSVYEKSQVVRISEIDLLQVLRNFKLFYNKLQRQDLFTYYKSGTVICEARRDDIIEISLMSSNEFIKLEPGVISNVNGEPLPGVFLYINMNENKAELSIDEFEYILFRLDRLNMSSEAMQLVLARLLLEDRINSLNGVKEEDIEKPKTNKYTGGSIFDRNNYEKREEPVDNRVILNTPKSLDDL